MTADRIVRATAALVFLGSAAVTIAWCSSMADMGGMSMPGGWTMSMSWMRMPGQNWAQSTASFVGMWAMMMVAMMLPSLTPALRGNRLADAACLAAAYFGVWTLAGIVIYPVGVVLAELEMRMPALARIVPEMAAAALAVAGIMQLSGWKSRQLDCCRSTPAPATTMRRGWHRGITLGLRCCACCAPLTAALLVSGVMDLGAMSCATAAISLERLAPRGRAIARVSGALLIAAAGTALLRPVGA